MRTLYEQVPDSLRLFLAALGLFACGCATAQSVANQFQRPIAGDLVVTNKVGDYESTVFHGNHLGIDIRATVGTEVRAVADGTVKYSENVYCLGHAINIEHTLPDGTRVVSVYYHLQRKGEGGEGGFELPATVRRGDLIGYVRKLPVPECGTGDHLHFGIRFGEYDSRTDARTNRWFYPGYSSIFVLPAPPEVKLTRLIDPSDPKHEGITAEWERDPLGFIDSRSEPSQPPPTVNSASCTAPVVGQAMTCSVVGTSLPATVSASASNCSPTPMTAVNGSTSERREFTCTPVTAGQTVEVSYTVPGFIGPLPLIPPAVAAAQPTSPPVVYSQVFEAEPGWQTDQPGNFYWNQTNQTYTSRTYTGVPATRPNRYGGVELPTFDPNRGFTLTWDQRIVNVVGSASVFFGLTSPDRLVLGSTPTGGPFLVPESTLAVGVGRIGSSEYTRHSIYIAGGQPGGIGNLGGSGTHGPTFAFGTWYRFSMRYDPAVGQVTFTTVDRETNAPMPYYNFTKAVPANAFSPNMRWLGVANDAIGVGGFGNGVPTDYVDSEFDNVSLRYLQAVPVYTPTLSVSPRIVERGGTATLSWDTGGAPVSECTLTVAGVPLSVLVAPTGSYTLTNVAGRTTYTLTCGTASAIVTIDVVPTGGET